MCKISGARLLLRRAECAIDGEQRRARFIAGGELAIAKIGRINIGPGIVGRLILHRHAQSNIPKARAIIEKNVSSSNHRQTNATRIRRRMARMQLELSFLDVYLSSATSVLIVGAWTRIWGWDSS